MDPQTSNVSESFLYNGQFGIGPHTSFVQPYSRTYISNMLVELPQLHPGLANENILQANKQVFLEYLLINISIKQNFPMRQIRVPVNLSHISVLPNLVQFLNNVPDSIIQLNFIQNGNLNMSLVNHIISNPAPLSVLKEFRVISVRQYNVIKSLIKENNIRKKSQISDFDDISRKSQVSDFDNINRQNQVSDFDNIRRKSQVPDVKNISIKSEVSDVNGISIKTEVPDVKDNISRKSQVSDFKNSRRRKSHTPDFKNKKRGKSHTPNFKNKKKGKRHTPDFKNNKKGKSQPPNSKNNKKRQGQVPNSKNNKKRKNQVPDFEDNISRRGQVPDFMGNISRKRETPDFVDQHVKLAKRRKIQVAKKKHGNFSSYFPNHTVRGKGKTLTKIEVFKNRWNINTFANPHIDHTYRINSSAPQRRRSVWFNKKRNISILSFFDEELEKLDSTICRIRGRILDLYAQYSFVYNFGTSCKIDDEIRKLTSQEHDLNNKYALLCAKRREISHIYASSNAFSINLDAEFVTAQELAIFRSNRNMLNGMRECYESYFLFPTENK